DAIDLAEFTTSTGPSTAAVTFTGIKTTGGIASQTFVLDGSAFAPQQFIFGDDFSDLVAVVWLQSSPGHQFDNINVTAIPEPTSAICIALGSFVVLVRRRR
ncbi:MAG: hypothetical protein AAGA30_05490, partial [Planctomycetota bacterium]